MSEYVWAFLIAAGIAILVTPAVIKLAEKTGAMDKPDKRKVHKKPIPRIGGLGIYIAFMISVITTVFVAMPYVEMRHEIIGLIFSASLIVLLGLVDDYKNLPARTKFLGQILIAMILVLGFDVRIDFITDPFGDYLYLESWVAIPATIFWLVGLTNTVNLIDGLDGLAAGISAIASVTIFLVALQNNFFLVAGLTAALAGAAAGFLFFNFHPAKIFMGDTGSMFFGFMLAGISVMGSMKSTATITLVVPILALGVPILDTAFAIIRRLLGGQPIFKPDKGHLHHRLLNLGFTQRQAVFLIYVISAVLGLSAIALTEVSSQIAILILAIVIVAIFYGAKKLGVLRMAN